MDKTIDKITRRFLLGENVSKPTIFSYIQSITEIVGRLAPKTLREKRDLEIAKDQLREVRRLGRKLQEQVNVLEEQVKVLEETKENKLEEGKIVHKVNADLEALCRKYSQGWTVPDAGSRSKSWSNVTCKSCLRKKNPKETKEK